MTGLHWDWIAWTTFASLPLGVAAAYPLWRTRQVILGNLAGSAAIFLVALIFIFREHAQLDIITQACLDAGVTCWPVPSAFIRFAIYASIGLFEVFALFLMSIRVEHRARRRGYSPEWR